MSIIEDALLLQMSKDFNSPIILLPESLLRKKKKTKQEQFSEEFNSLHTAETNVTRVTPSPMPG